tara:strand:+ start:202 stop:912 length:711 start_codon:yes stop_codon:yes gene_type:complete
MINYNNSIIYKLVSNNLEITEFYIGSTVNFTRRKNKHKSCCHNPNGKSYNRKVYQFIRNNGGWQNWDMVLVEKTPCVDKLELRKIEREFMEKLGSSLNMVSAYQSKEELKEYQKIYSESNKDKIKEQKKEYREINTEKIKEQNKEYRENNKDKIKEQNKIYFENNKEKKKEYQEINKEKIKEYRKIYNENNKDKIKEKREIYIENNKEKIKEQNKIYYQKSKKQTVGRSPTPYDNQ